MSIILCSVCDQQFDTDIQVEAQYDPPICEDCLMEAEEENQHMQAQLQNEDHING